MSTYILVHGAWHYGELWAQVADCLESHDHEVHTPTAGGLNNTYPGVVGLDDCWRPISQYIIDHDLNDFILVGHSWGGYVITKVAIAHHDRLRRLVYHNAFVPEHGRSLFDEIPPMLRHALRGSAEKRGDETMVLPFQAWRDMFIGDATYDFAREMYEQLRPHPYRTFIEAADMTGWEQVTVPKSYLHAYEDNDITQGVWGRHPRLSNRLGMFRLVGMPGSHQVLQTRPQMLAEKIIEAGRD